MSEEETDFKSETKASDEVKTTISKPDTGEGSFSGPCARCGKSIHGGKMINGKVKCPDCNQEF